MKNFFPLWILFFINLFLSPSESSAQWVQTNGPYGGSVKCVALIGTNLFAGTSVGYGGVFLSTNDGTSWTSVNSGLTNTVVLSLAASGTNLFAGTDSGGVFLSSNNGTSWTAANSGLTNKVVNSLVVNGTNLFAGTSYGGVFLSSNNGTSWTAVNSGLTNTVVLSFAVSGTNLFAGTSYGGVFLSTNNGTSWTAVNSGLTNMIVNALAVNGTNLFAGTDGGGVFLSTDNGTSWTPSVLSNMTVNSLFVKGTNLFAGTSGFGGVFLSTNNGTSWSPANSGLPNTGVYSLTFSGMNLFAGTNGGGVYLSTNNGTSWTAASSGLTNTSVYSLAVSPNGTGGMNLFAGTVEKNTGTSYGGGVFLSTNNGTSWTAVNSGLPSAGIPCLAVSPAAGGTGGTNLFAGILGGLFLSTNNGTSWTPTGITDKVVMSLAVSGTNLFAAINWVGVFLSTNNGTNWTPVNSGLTNTSVMSLAISSASGGAGGTNLFAGTNGGGVFLSTNNGTSWTAVNSGLTKIGVYSLTVSPATEGIGEANIFAGTNSGGVFLTTNYGTTWTEVNSGLPNMNVLSLTVSGTNIFAGTDGGGIFLSTNNGASWTAVNSGLLPNITVNTLAINGTNLFAGTSFSGVWSRPLSDMITPLAQEAAEYYLPLHVGNYVQLHTEVIPSGSTWGARTITYSIEGSDTISGQLYFREKGREIADNHNFDNMFLMCWLRKDSIGNVVLGAYSESSPDIDSATIVNGIMFPNGYLTKGFSTTFPNGEYTEKDSVVSITETVSVPAGTFTNCIELSSTKYDTNDSVVYQVYEYYAYGIGMVKSVRTISTNNAHVDELIAYTNVTSVEGQRTGIFPTGFSLEQNYPNPFNPITTISFTLPGKAFISLKVFDLLGREITTLASKELPAGKYARQWHAAGLPSGVYFYRLSAVPSARRDLVSTDGRDRQAGSFKETKKLLLLK